MKKIIFNGATVALKETFGVQRNTVELLTELDKLVDYGQIQLTIPNETYQEFSFKNIEVKKIAGLHAKGRSINKWNWFDFSRYVKQQDGIGVDMILGLPLLGCDVVAIYDCIPILFPQNANTVRKKISTSFYNMRAALNLKQSKCVITDSENAKEDIIRFYKVAPSKVHVIPCAWQHFERIKPDESIFSKLKIELDDEYFFSLGSRFVHKNFKWIIEAAKQNPEYKFIASGSTNGISDNNSDENLPSNLIFAGYLSDGEVKALMMHCKAFVQPSLCEGFGIPPMEAMSVGANCIVSNVSSLPEVYGSAVWYIDPYNYNNINMDEIMSAPKDDNKKVLETYSWKQNAKMLKDILWKLADEP